MTPLQMAKAARDKAYIAYLRAPTNANSALRGQLNDANEQVRMTKRLIDKGVKNLDGT